MAIALAAEKVIRFRQSQRMGGIYTIEDMYITDSVYNLRIPKPNKSTKTIHIDSHGFRNDEPIMPKPDELVRIAYLGASTTFCAEVSSNEKTWPHITTELLRNQYPRVRMDYINAGVPGYTLETSLRHMRNLVAPFKPDVIVIYHATNDLSGEMRELATEQGIYHAGDIDESWLAKKSVLWNLLEKNIRIISAQYRAKSGQSRLKFDNNKIGSGFEHELELLLQEARKISPIVAIATFSIQIRPQQTQDEKLKAAASALYYMPFMTPDSLIQAFNRYNEIIRNVAKRNNALVIESAEKIPGNGENFNDSVHFKDAGSLQMARLVAPVIAESADFASLLGDKKK